MKPTYTILFLLISTLTSGQMISNQVVTGPAFDYGRDFRMILERTKDKNDTLAYNKLLRRFLENDTSLTRGETLALMIGFTENPNYRPVEQMETEKEIIELNDNGYYEDALIESKTYLAKHPLSLSTLKERSYAYHQLGNKDSAKYFMALADRIMEAMIYSGSGKGNNPEIPFFSLGLNDGDYFIPNVGLSLTKKATEKDRSKRTLYVTTAMTDEGTYKLYYFMIHHAIMKMDGDAAAEKASNKKLKKAQAKRAAKKGKKTGSEEGSETETPATDENSSTAEPTENSEKEKPTSEETEETAKPVEKSVEDTIQLLPPPETAPVIDSTPISN
ncbi:MAG: DUF4919 domain-containing protein [Chitinophagaceae bacterium]|nr:MAG: DUF4919 domain-containing protein [Chitinophagaceae bacterium]